MPVELQMLLWVSQKLFRLHSLQDMNSVAYQVVLEHHTHTCQLFASDRVMKLQKNDYILITKAVATVLWIVALPRFTGPSPDSVFERHQCLHSKPACF